MIRTSLAGGPGPGRKSFGKLEYCFLFPAGGLPTGPELTGFASEQVSVVSYGTWRFERVANDDTLLSKPSDLEKLEEDRRKGDQILEVIFGMMPVSMYVIFFMSWVLSVRPWWGTMLL